MNHFKETDASIDLTTENTLSEIKTIHQPVLLNETLLGLNLKPTGHYLDVTFGGGGHSKGILDTDSSISLTAVDWDKDTVDRASDVMHEKYGSRFNLLWGNFAHLYKLQREFLKPKCDGILADFGTSTDQIFNKDGLSFNKKSFLDMRMSKNHQQATAADILNSSSEKELYYIFHNFGEERNSHKIAKKIVEHRNIKKILYTNQLVEIISEINGPKIPNRIHPSTRVFQALRIAVNKEFENIISFLKAAIPLLNKNGRLACISFHSLEDRIVKNFFKEQADLGIVQIITKKPIEASDAEIKNNPSSRSAKLRIVEKL